MESSRSEHLDDLRAELRHWAERLRRSGRGPEVDERFGALAGAVDALAAARDAGEERWRELDRAVGRAWERFREAFKDARHESPARRSE